MGILKDVALGMSAIIEDQFIDLCDITFTQEIDDGSGALIPDPSSPVVRDIPCFYEPYRYPRFKQLESGFFSEDVTHDIIMRSTSDTIRIRPVHTITIQARDERPVLIFDRPQRKDEALSPLVIVAAILRDQ